MKIAVISDIHGNMEAFREVLADIDKTGIGTIFCLGDNISYGPESDQVVKLVQSRQIPCVMGNHERVVIDPGRIGWFNPIARESLEKTIEMLSEDTVNFIRDLPLFEVRHECRFVHGFPPDFVNMYLFQVSHDTLKSAFKKMQEKICFVGHTHELQIIGFDGKVFEHMPIRKPVIKHLYKDRQYIVNVGSVGQPRDGNNNSKYVIWDSADYTLEIRFIPYDIAAVAEKIINAGLPKSHADRLW